MNKNDVEQFLSEFKTKLDFFDIQFLDDGNKNFQALLELNITYLQKIEYLKKLKVENYLSRPNKDKLRINLGDFWEFGI